MEGEKALKLLNGKTHKDRLDGIAYVSSALRTQEMILQSTVNASEFIPDILKALAQVLVDTNWNVKREALALAANLLPSNSIAANYLLANLLVCLCDTKVTIRKAAAAAISNWLNSTKDLDKALDLIDKRGLQSQSPQLRAEVLGFLQSDQCIYTSSVAGMARLLIGITKRVMDSDEDVKFAAQQSILEIMRKADQSVVAEAVEKIPSGLRQRYFDLKDTHHNEVHAPAAPVLKATIANHAPASTTDDLMFGFLPRSIVLTVRSSDILEERIHALKDIQQRIDMLSTGTAVLPHLKNILGMLFSFLDDVNLKIIIGSLEAIGGLVRKLGWPLRNHLGTLVQHLSKLLGDSKIVVRQSAARLINRLMHTLTPTPVLEMLLDLDKPSWRIQEEVINIVIVAVSTFLPDRFDFEQLVARLHNGLHNSKSRIKFVTIEALAVIATVIGENSLWKILNPYNIDDDTKKIIKQRLDTTDELPAISDDGTVHHPNLQSSLRSRTPSSISQAATTPGRMPWLAALGSRGDQTMSSLSSKAPSASSFSPINGFMSTPEPIDHSSFDKSSGSRSGGSYARIHQCRLAGSSSRSTPSYASWARRSKKLKKGVSTSSDIREYRPSISPDKKDRIPFVNSRMARPSSRSLSASSMSGRRKGSHTLTPDGKERQASQSPVRGLDLLKHDDQMQASNDYSEKPKNRNSHIRGANGKVKSQHSKIAAHSNADNHLNVGTSKIARTSRNCSDSGVSYGNQSKASVPHQHNSPSVSRSADLASHSRNGIDIASPVPQEEEPDCIELSAPKRPHQPTYGPHSITTRYPRRGSLTDTLSTTLQTPLQHQQDLPPPSLTSSPSQRSIPSPSKKKEMLSNSHTSPHVSNRVEANNRMNHHAVHEQESSLEENNANTVNSIPKLPEQVEKRNLAKTEQSGSRNSLLPTFGFKEQARQREQEKQQEKERQEQEQQHKREMQRLEKLQDREREKQEQLRLQVEQEKQREQERQDKLEKLAEERRERLQQQRLRREKREREQAQQAEEEARRAEANRQQLEEAAQVRDKQLQINHEFIAKQQEVTDVCHAPEENENEASSFSKSAISSGNLEQLSNDTVGDNGDTGDNSLLSTQPPTNSAKHTVSQVNSVRPTPRRPPKSRHNTRATQDITRTRLRATARPGGGKVAGNDPFLVDIGSLEPLTESPEATWRQAQSCLERGNNQEKWNEKCVGLTLWRRIINGRPEFAQSILGEAVRAVLLEVKNLRSAVSRLAILTVGDMCRLLAKPMEKHADEVAMTVLTKAGGEASVFIKEDAEVTMLDFVESLSPFKVMCALLPLTTQKNKDIRRMSSKLLLPCLQRGGSKILAHKETPLLLRNIARLVADGDQETRYNGRILANELMLTPDHESIFNRHLEGRALKDLLTACETVRTKGIGPPPLAATQRAGAASASTAIAAGRTSATVASTASIRKTSVSSVESRGSAATATPRRNKTTVNSRTAAAAAAPSVPFKTATGDDLLMLLGKDLNASDWKTREDAIGRLHELVVSSPNKFIGTATNIFFDFVPRLQDSNSKVSASALKSMSAMIPHLPDSLDTVMAELLGALSFGLASKNATIKGLTKEVLHLLVTRVNPSHVAQPFMVVMTNSNSVVKESLIPFLTELVVALSEANPKLLQKHILRGCVKLLPDNKLRPKTAPVWTALHQAMGESMFKTKGVSDSTTAQIKQLLS